jgi:hypothetical protein
MFHRLVPYTSLGLPALSQQEESLIPDDPWEIRTALISTVLHLLGSLSTTYTYLYRR